MFRFQQPWYALLLLPLAAGAVLTLFRRPPALTVSSAAPFKGGGLRAGAGHPSRWPLWLGVLGLALCIVALMRPQHGMEKSLQRAEGVDIMLVLDVSPSMRAYDIPQGINDMNSAARAISAGTVKSRVEVAKDELRRFVEKRPDDRIGLVIFSALPYTVCPPTLDHDFLVNRITTFEAGMLGDATNIAGPLASATARLKDSPAKRRVAVLFTDGGNNVQDKVTPEQAADLAKTFNVAVYTVGIGSDRSVMAMQTPFGNQLQQLGGSDFDPKLLQDIADKTGARYFVAADAKGFAQAMKEIDMLEKVKMETPRYMDYSERFMPLLWAGLLLLGLAFLLERTVLQTVP